MNTLCIKKVIILCCDDYRGIGSIIKELAIRKLQNKVEVIFVNKNNKEIFSSPEHNFNCDILISYLCPFIIPKKILDNSTYKINFHSAPPEYPGSFPYNWAIYEESNMYGVTCHHMNQKVDSGDIIMVERFPIIPGENVKGIQEKATDKLLQMFEYIIDIIEKGGNIETCKNEAWVGIKRTKKDIESLRKITLDMDQNEIKRRINSNYHPDYPEFNAYIEIKGFKFYAR